jgi:hypothetical protein
MIRRTTKSCCTYGEKQVMSRLPVPGQDKGTWGSILNDYLLQSLDGGGLLLPEAVSISGAELTANKNQPSGYAGLDSLGNVSVTGRVIQVGPVTYPYTASLSGGGINSAYILIDKA